MTRIPPGMYITKITKDKHVKEDQHDEKQTEAMDVETLSKLYEEYLKQKETS